MRYSKKHILSIIAFILFFATVQATTIDTTDNKDKPSVSLEHNIKAQTLILKSLDSNYAIEIFDKEGNTLKSATLNKNSTLKISISDIQPGVYFLRYVGSDIQNNSVKKIVIK